MSLLVLSFANDSFAVRNLPKELFSSFFAARLIPIDRKTMIQTWWVLDDGWRIEQRVDTLDLLSGWPVELLHPHSVSHIDTLIFQSEPGGLDLTGSCQLTIFGDSIQLVKESDAFPKSPIEGGGHFAARLDTPTASRLKSLIESIDWESLKNEYRAPGTDQKTGILILSYNKGKRKKLQDYGNMGTYRLGIFENMLLDMLLTQSWKRTFPGDPKFIYSPDGFSVAPATSSPHHTTPGKSKKYPASRQKS